MEEMDNNTTIFEESLNNTTSPAINYTTSEIDLTTDYSLIDTEYNEFDSSEQTMTSTIIPTEHTSSTDQSLIQVNNSQMAHSQLLYKLCQQLLSRILPNASSSSAAAAAAALSLVSGSSSGSNNTADAVISWIKQQLSSSSTTSTTTTPSSSSVLPSLLLNGRKLSSIPLHRVDMDDIVHQLSNDIDGEH
jgi:hypothetical protein